MREAVKGVIGVVGAGTMGAGIAQVALQAGWSAVLFDVQPAVLERATASIQRNLHRLAEKGKLPADEADRLFANLQTSGNLSDMASARFVIEAAPEKMDLKRSIFAQLEEVCSADTVLATNTSSLSITVLAAGCRHPERIVGMHFFNPAPVMKLVEVIVGDDTSAPTVDAVMALARAFAKEPIVCKDTPGFIVNRVARNFYGEALRVVGEGSASKEVVDGLMERGAGFKMGPFTLMDLVGIDVNFDVTRSVYHAYHEEPRFRPHTLQERMVAAGRLGRKTGRGFYPYNEAGQRIAEDPFASLNVGTFASLDRVVVVGDTDLANGLRAQLSARSGRSRGDCGLVYASSLPAWDKVALEWRAEETEAYLRQQNPLTVFVHLAGDETYLRAMLQAVERGISERALVVTSLSGASATEQASWLKHGERVRGFSVLSVPASEADGLPTLEWSMPLQASSSTAVAAESAPSMVSLAAALGFVPVQVRDGAGGVALRILAMICNEAAEVIREGVATAADVDIGMRLGTNYPRGPAEWMDELGIPLILSTLAALWKEYGEDRYRPSPMLRQMAAAGWSGRRAGRGWYQYDNSVTV